MSNTMYTIRFTGEFKHQMKICHAEYRHALRLVREEQEVVKIIDLR